VAREAGVSRLTGESQQTRRSRVSDDELAGAARCALDARHADHAERTGESLHSGLALETLAARLSRRTCHIDVYTAHRSLNEKSQSNRGRRRVNQIKIKYGFNMSWQTAT